MSMRVRRHRVTDQIEMVETHNLALSLRRLKDIGPYDQDKWKRALYHAIVMTYTPRLVSEKIRIALELP